MSCGAHTSRMLRRRNAFSITGLQIEVAVFCPRHCNPTQVPDLSVSKPAAARRGTRCPSETSPQELPGLLRLLPGLQQENEEMHTAKLWTIIFTLYLSPPALSIGTASLSRTLFRCCKSPCSQEEPCIQSRFRVDGFRLIDYNSHE